MKGWQIILTGLLPYVLCFFMINIITFIIYDVPLNWGRITFNWSMYLLGLIPYFFIILPWSFVQYLMLHHYNKRAFYYGTLGICLLQPILVAILIKLPIGSTEFFVILSPILIVGILTSMFCIQFFYKRPIQVDQELGS